jgi:multidrug efflux system membrane fusion protein
MQNSSVIGSRRVAGYVRLLTTTCASLIAVTGCAKKPPARPPQPAVAVTVVPVRRASVPYDVSATGVVTPLQTAAVTSQVDGIVIGVDFAEGKDVTKGQVLFRIDPHPYQSAYDFAVATLARDRATAAYAVEQARRYDELAKSRSVTVEQNDQIQSTAASAVATVAADSATVRTARFNLDNTTIRAPISGRTGGLLVHVGNVVHAAGSAPLLVINQVRPTLVRFAVPGSTLPLILRYGGRGGLPVTAMPTDAPPPGAFDSVPALDPSARQSEPARPAGAPKGSSGTADRGVLSFIDNAVDTTTETLMLKATFPNSAGTMWAGQIVAATLRLYVEDSALVVPTGSVVTGQNGTYVWVVDSVNTVLERPVVVERAAGNISVITSGVADGDRVVTSGQARLTSGATVTLSTRSDSTGGTRAGARAGRCLLYT